MRRRGRRPQIDPARRQLVTVDVVAALLSLTAAGEAARAPAGDSADELRAATIARGARCLPIRAVTVEAAAGGARLRIDLAVDARAPEAATVTLDGKAYWLVWPRGREAQKLALQLKRALHELRGRASGAVAAPRARILHEVELRLVATRAPSREPCCHLVSDAGAADRSGGTLRITTWDDLRRAR